MKKHVLLSALALFASTVMADTIQLSVNNSNGEHTVYNVDDLVNITFDGDDMVIQHANGSDRHLIDNIEDMIFGTVSGIEEVRDFDLNDGLNVAIRGNILTATLPDGEITLRVFDINGRAVDTSSSRSEISYDLAELAKGTYIIMVNDKALKFIR